MQDTQRRLCCAFATGSILWPVFGLLDVFVSRRDPWLATWLLEIRAVGWLVLQLTRTRSQAFCAATARVRYCGRPSAALRWFRQSSMHSSCAVSRSDHKTASRMRSSPRKPWRNACPMALSSSRPHRHISIPAAPIDLTREEYDRQAWGMQVRDSWASRAQSSAWPRVALPKRRVAPTVRCTAGDFRDTRHVADMTLSAEPG